MSSIPIRSCVALALVSTVLACTGGGGPLPDQTGQANEGNGQTSDGNGQSDETTTSAPKDTDAGVKRDAG